MRVAFWNASIAPRAVTRKEPDDMVFAQMIRHLLDELAMDVLVLCEISTIQEKVISKLICETGHLMESGIQQAGRGMFDLCLIYSSNADLIRKPIPILYSEANRTSRAALRFDLRLQEIDTMLYLYCCHWPSRLQSESEHDRARLANSLRNDLEREGVLSGDQDAIVLGDFNDEPYNNSLTQTLRATRDRSFVGRSPHLLFNASWEQMGACLSPLNGERCSGTYFYKGGTLSKWFTFDQMLFSSSLLQEGGWQLTDAGCMTIVSPWYSEYVTSGASHFDHFPIFSIIKNTLSEAKDDGL